MRCPSCHREIDGKDVEPGDFIQNPKLRKAGIAQWCKECQANVPAGIIAELKEKPEWFIKQARLAERHEKFRQIDNHGVGFRDELTVVKTNPGGVEVRGKWL